MTRLLLRPMRLACLICFVGLSWGVPPRAIAQESDNAADAPLAVGDQAPGFELSTFDGAQVALEQFQGDDGKTVVLTFVRAHW